MKEIRNTIKEFREKRGWQNYDTEEILAKSIIIESAELLEHFQWNNKNYNIEEVSKELADVLIYTISMCHHLNLDPEEIIKNKLLELAIRCPVKGES